MNDTVSKGHSTPFIHLMDWSVFSPFVIEQFESIAPGKNAYLVENIHPAARSIEREPYGCKVDYLGDDSCSLLRRFSCAKAVFIHGMWGRRVRLAGELPSQPKLFWFSWGSDIYSHIDATDNLYGPKTREYLASRTGLAKKSVNYIKVQFAAILRRIGLRRDAWRRAVARVDYCAPVVPGEIDLLRTINEFHAIPIRFNYGNLSSIIGEDGMNKPASSNDVLVANSNSPSSNHLEALEAIRSWKNFNGRVIVPLNYGSDVNYQNHIIEQGRSIFGSRFCPILDFLPHDEFLQLLRTCRTGVFAHLRQQGAGTALAMLWFGSTLLMNSNNPLYSFLRSLGLQVDALDRHTEQPPEIPFNRVRQSRIAIAAEYSEPIVQQRIREIVSIASTETRSSA